MYLISTNLLVSILWNKYCLKNFQDKFSLILMKFLVFFEKPH